MEFFVSLFVLLLIKMIEWGFKFLGLCFKGVFWLMLLPFKILDLAASSGSTSTKSSYSPSRKTYSDPINKAMDRFENHPEDMDMEDLFWIDEILGDD